MARAAELLKQARLYADDCLIPIALGKPDDPGLDLEDRQKAAKEPAWGVKFSAVTLENWEEHWPHSHAINIGIRCGRGTEVVGIDIDVK